jgi:hypothetical protein
MAMIEQHIEDCMNLIGEPHVKVHRWLDEYAKLFSISFFNDYHRTFRHNTYGLECIKGMWGYDAEKAGRLHLIRDYLERPLKGKMIVDKYIKGNNFNKMMKYWNNPMNMELVISNDVIQAWIKEGFGLVALSTRDIIEVNI